MIRYYGKEPFQVAVIHGGPGASGSVAAIHGDYDPHPAEGIEFLPLWKWLINRDQVL